MAKEAEQLPFFRHLDQRYSLTIAGCGCKALASMAQSPIDIIVTQSELVDMTGSELIARAAMDFGPVAGVVIHPNIQACLEAEKTMSDTGLVKHLSQPVGEFTLFMTVDRLAEGRGV